MQERITSMGGAGETIVFAHANGYPPGSYRQLFEALADRCQIQAFHHRPLWDQSEPPSRINWSLFANDFLETLEHTQRGPVWVMGHSLGGTVAAVAAARKPGLFRGLLLLDPVFTRTRDALRLRVQPVRRLQRTPMISRALRRPHRFDSRQQAFEFYRGKRAFAGFSDAAIWDYVDASLDDDSGGGVRLRWSGRWEAAVYSSVPWIWPTLRRVSLPTLGLRGEDSTTLTEAMFQRWRRVQPAAELQTCPGGHLFPMENPEEAAARVRGFLDAQST
jgi:pimeloyl-ACP methyl ester carboxylesterase